jgi:hypothetical protein
MWRIKGPEIDGSVYYRVPFQFGLLVIQVAIFFYSCSLFIYISFYDIVSNLQEYLERVEISLIRDRTLFDLDAPRLQYEILFNELFENFGFTLNKTGIFNRQLFPAIVITRFFTI